MSTLRILILNLTCFVILFPQTNDHAAKSNWIWRCNVYVKKKDLSTSKNSSYSRRGNRICSE